MVRETHGPAPRSGDTPRLQFIPKYLEPFLCSRRCHERWGLERGQDRLSRPLSSRSREGNRPLGYYSPEPRGGGHRRGS